MNPTVSPREAVDLVESIGIWAQGPATSALIRRLKSMETPIPMLVLAELHARATAVDVGLALLN